MSNDPYMSDKKNCSRDWPIGRISHEGGRRHVEKLLKIEESRLLKGWLVPQTTDRASLCSCLGLILTIIRD